MSKYGETHDIFNTHHTETKAKLDSLLAKNTQIEVNNDGVEALLTTNNSSLTSILTKNGEIDSVLDASKIVLDNILVKNGEIDTVLDNILVKNSEIDTVLDSSKVVLDNILVKNGEIDTVLDSSKVVLDNILVKNGEIDTVLDSSKVVLDAISASLSGVLSVSSPVISKSSQTPINNQVIYGQSDFTSAEIDISTKKHISIIGSSTEIYFSHEFDLLVSNVSGGVFFETSHSGYFLDGFFHTVISNVPYKFIKLKVKNTDGAVGNSANFTLHLLDSN